MTDQPTDSELAALRVVLPRQFTVERGDGHVLLTLHERRGSDPLVTWALRPADSGLGGPLLTEWAEHLGATALTGLESIDGDDRLERIARLTADSTQALGDAFLVTVDAVHA
jgi:hypothetical protein